MKRETTEKLEKLICRELDIIADRGDLDERYTEHLDKLLHSMKCLKRIETMEMEEGESQAYSMRGMSRDGRWEASGAYDAGNSYRRRDSMGRYARTGYSRDDGGMIEKIERMRDEADPEEREVYERLLRTIR